MPRGPRAITQRPKKPRTAVVVIHGMGEQWPMETLRGFVQAVWTCDPEVVAGDFNSQIYSKPESITGSFELRRITTRDWSGAKGRRVDFFEFYWAHMMQGNTLDAVRGWLWRLLVRPRSRVPDRLVGAWIAGLMLIAVTLLLTIAAAFKWAPKGDVVGPLWALFGVASSLLIANWVLPVLGDAARYLSPTPGNVAVRQAIRAAGIDLLTKLHATGDYDRIIVAGHSLGSVVGYDILNYAWGRMTTANLEAGHAPGSPAVLALDKLEAAARTLDVPRPMAKDRTAYRKAQRDYFAVLSTLKDDKGAPMWLVSDFVTLGCPLSKSDMLLAKDPEDLKAKKAIRDVPTDPPWLEREPGKPPSLAYNPGGSPNRIPHHAAAFAPTVWTNVFFPNKLGWMGDFISGAVASQLGAGVRDVRVPIGGARFRHLDYWSKPDTLQPWIKALRRAVNLRGHDKATLWGMQVDSEAVAAEALPDRIKPEPSLRRRKAPPKP